MNLSTLLCCVAFLLAYIPPSYSTPSRGITAQPLTFGVEQFRNVSQFVSTLFYIDITSDNYPLLQLQSTRPSTTSVVVGTCNLFSSVNYTAEIEVTYKKLNTIEFVGETKLLPLNFACSTRVYILVTNGGYGAMAFSLVVYQSLYFILF